MPSPLKSGTVPRAVERVAGARDLSHPQRDEREQQQRRFLLPQQVVEQVQRSRQVTIGDGLGQVELRGFAKRRDDGLDVGLGDGPPCREELQSVERVREGREVCADRERE